MECQYKLMRYGIPQDILTIDSCGSLKEQKFLALVEQQRLLEEMDQRDEETRSSIDMTNGALEQPEAAKSTIRTTAELTGLVVSVTAKDVLLGKGGCRQKHPANARLSELIEINRLSYQSSPSKVVKSNISMSIVQVIKAHDGRFLKRRGNLDDDCWFEISDKEARDAISHRLRNKVPRRVNRGGLSVEQNFTNGVHGSSVPDNFTFLMTEGSRKRAKLP